MRFRRLAKHFEWLAQTLVYMHLMAFMVQMLTWTMPLIA